MVDGVYIEEEEEVGGGMGEERSEGDFCGDYAAETQALGLLLSFDWFLFW